MTSAERLARAVILFWSPSPWGPDKAQLWQELTGTSACTSVVLCDLARQVRDEESRVLAALRGYEVMLTHFENVFLEVQARLREMHDQDPVEVASHEAK